MLVPRTLERVAKIRTVAEDVAQGLGRTPLADAIARKYPSADRQWAWQLARSTVYAAGRADGSPAPGVVRARAGQRGPRPLVSDEALLAEIRSVLRESPFLSEGHKKVTVRLRKKGIRVGKNRVLRLLREHGLLAPVRRVHQRGDRAHQGTIRAAWPNELWSTDATRFWTEEEGRCWFFGAVDHCTTEVVGWHGAKKGDRWAALEPERQGVRAHFGAYRPKAALGLRLRHDWGPQYTAAPFQGELRWLGIRSSPAFVGEPEGNGICERFMRTLKEECVYVHCFRNLEEARAVIAAFIERYNHEWLVERHGYRTPAEVRRQLTLLAA